MGRLADPHDGPPGRLICALRDRDRPRQVRVRAAPLHRRCRPAPPAARRSRWAIDRSLSVRSKPSSRHASLPSLKDRHRVTVGTDGRIRACCGCSSMAERQLPKLHTRVRFPSPAPALHMPCGFAVGRLGLSSHPPHYTNPSRLDAHAATCRAREPNKAPTRHRVDSPSCRVGDEGFPR